MKCLQFYELMEICQSTDAGLDKLQALADASADPEWHKLAQAAADTVLAREWVGAKPDTLVPAELTEALLQAIEEPLYLRHGRSVLSTCGARVHDVAVLSAIDAYRQYGGSAAVRALAEGGTELPMDAVGTTGTPCRNAPRPGRTDD